jgi:sugar lactone lactonase YvrE
MQMRSLIAALAVLGAASALPMADAGAHTGSPPTGSRRGPDEPTVTVINDSALHGVGSGSAVGPDKALYVTNGTDGTLVRIDPRTGAAKVVGTGLPPKVVEIGGAIDVAFRGRRTYALVTLAGADLGVPAAAMGIYELGDDGEFSLFADIGAYAAAHPPADPDVFLAQGVQYALDVWHGELLVTDGHHARVYRVDRRGSVSEFLAFSSTDDLVTGIAVDHGRVYLAAPGPIPHAPATSKVLEVRPGGDAAVVGAWSSGYQGKTGLIVDVEFGPHDRLYGLLQGHWDLAPVPDNEGFPAARRTGELVRVKGDGTFETVVAGLDQPTSVDFIGKSAFVVTLTGTIVRLDGF